MNVTELRERLEEIEEEHPDAEVRIDPPYTKAFSILYRKEEDTVELSH